MTKDAGFIGVLMLDTAFPRIRGDAGNPESYPMPVQVRRVAGADVPLIVRGEAPDATMIQQFIDAAQELEAQGAVGIITTCGFLAHAQTGLAQGVHCPVLASALSLGPMARAMTGGRRLGILTADAGAMSGALLAAAGLSAEEVAIAGMEDSPIWQRLILAPKTEQASTLDPDEIGALAEERARALMAAHPDLGAILLECANLPPYAERIRTATGLPVFHILQAAQMLWASALDLGRV